LIVLIAFGKRGYGLMAHNLAFTLRHNSPNVKIGLWISQELFNELPDKTLYNDIRILDDAHYIDKGKIDPAIAKAQIYRLGCQMADKFLYLDVDAICINDIEPFLKRLEGLTIATEVLGQGTKEQFINYSAWATNKDIWETFNLPENTTVCGIQSSWVYFEKSDICDKMQEYLDYYMKVGIPRYKLTMQWGGTLPDELLYQGVYAKLGIVPSFDSEGTKPIFFGHAKQTETEQEVLNGYYILSLYGNGVGKTLVKDKWFKLHDRYLRLIGDVRGFTSKIVMSDKHLNNK
jgi:hypothetical protein